VSADALQRAFKTFLDPTRVRILALLAHDELAVQEISDALGMGQSRVSRHLAILREAGLLADRREGTYVFYRFDPPADGVWREAWALVERELERDPRAARDRTAAARVVAARAARARRFFDSVGPQWDALREGLHDEALRARAMARLLPPQLRVADIGTGTGILALELAREGLRVIAVDHSPRMLAAAREKIEQSGVSGIELRQGEASALPLADAEVDAAIAHMVLHYLPSPAEAIREMARVVAPGGRVVIADFVRHQQDWMRDELGVVWLGFEPSEISAWLAEARLVEARVERLDVAPPAQELPASFLASARVPA
jgi:ArsR family transcriptional regulator